MSNKESWDGFAEEYHGLVSDSGDIYHETYLNPLVLKLLGNVKSKKVLDLACGNGYFSKILANKGAIVTGVDYSEKMISIAKDNAKDNLKFFVGSSSNMDFLEDDSFDFVVSNVAFHDIKEISETIKECSRIVKDGHKLVFSIPHPAFYLSKRIKENNEYFKKIRKYISVSEIDHPSSFQDIKHYHRPIEYYMELLFNNDFVVSGFHEVTTRHSGGEALEEGSLLDFKKEIPTFLVVEATKVL